MDTQEDLTQEVEEIRGELADAHREIEQFRARWRLARNVITKAGGLVALVVVGPRLAKSIEAYLVKAQEELNFISPRETANVLAAVLRLFARVGVVALLTGLGPVLLLYWQNLEIRGQTEQFHQDSLVARRAQLLEIIYGEECERPAEVAERLTATSAEAGKTETPPPDNTRNRECGAAANPRLPRCWPRSPTRARADAVLAFVEIERGRGVMHPDLRGVNLAEAYLGEADLSGVSMIMANLAGARLAEANLEGAILASSCLEGASLQSANLSLANLYAADFSRARLSYAGLSGALFAETKFEEAGLHSANFSNSLLVGVDFSGAELSQANLAGATLKGAFRDGHTVVADVIDGVSLEDLSSSNTSWSFTTISQEQIDSAFGDSDTVLPKALASPDHWELPLVEQEALFRKLMFEAIAK